MANIAAAKENEEIALIGTQKDKVRKVPRAASGATKIRKEKGREDIPRDLLPETQTDVLKETAKVPRRKDQQVSVSEFPLDCAKYRTKEGWNISET